MKITPIRLFALAALSIVVGSGSAQTWRVDGAQQPRNLTNVNTDSAVAIDPVTGEAFVKTVPGGGGGGTPSVTLSPASTSGAPNAVINVGYSTADFTGTVTCNATTGSNASGWSATGLPGSGSRSVTLPATEGSVNLSMSCTGSNGTASKDVNINVTTSTCLNNVYTSIAGQNFSIADSGSQSFSSFNTWVSNNDLFPGYSSNGVNGEIFTTVSTNYAALEFVMTNDLIFDGSFTTTEQQVSPDNIILSLSECRGDFRTALNTGGRTCYANGGTVAKQGLDWTRPGNAYLGSGTRCSLVPGRTYYLNVGGQDGAGTSFGCGQQACQIKVTSKRQNDPL